MAPSPERAIRIEKPTNSALINMVTRFPSRPCCASARRDLQHEGDVRALAVSDCTVPQRHCKQRFSEGRARTRYHEEVGSRQLIESIRQAGRIHLGVRSEPGD